MDSEYFTFATLLFSKLKHPLFQIELPKLVNQSRQIRTKLRVPHKSLASQQHCVNQIILLTSRLTCPFSYAGECIKLVNQ